MHFIAFEAQKRGWHCLVFEGPGQVGAVHRNPGLHMRYDYEVPVKAVVDYLETRDDVDFDKLALVGYSLGGYLAPRAAAFEKRFKAVVANSLMVDFYKVIAGSVPPLFIRIMKNEALFRYLAERNAQAQWFVDHARWVFGVTKIQDIVQATREYNLWSVVDKISVPFLTIYGVNEFDNYSRTKVGRELVEELDKFYDQLKCDKTKVTFDYASGGALHCQIAGLEISQNYTMDWLNEKLKVNISDK